MTSLTKLTTNSYRGLNDRNDWKGWTWRLPLYQRVRDRIAQGIGRTWRPGDAIPSESELAKTHGVALGTLRKALDILVADGLLERFQGKGNVRSESKF